MRFGLDVTPQRMPWDEVVRRVKLADLEDNMDVRRMREVTEEDHARLARYRRAWTLLTGE